MNLTTTTPAPPSPEPAATTPEPAATTPEPAATTPESAATTPEHVATAAEHVATAPDTASSGCATIANEVQRRCPCCMSTVSSWKPIVYGLVDKTVRAQSRRGEVVLGGINHGRNEPRWQCGRCETRLGRPREELDRFGREVSAAGESTPRIAVPAWRLMKTMRLRAVRERCAA